MRASDGVLVALMLGFLGLTLVAAWSAWLIWRGRSVGAVLNLTLLPVEAVFWAGFALPVPWVIGLARAALVLLAWRSLGRPRERTDSARTLIGNRDAAVGPQAAVSPFADVRRKDRSAQSAWRYEPIPKPVRSGSTALRPASAGTDLSWSRGTFGRFGGPNGTFAAPAGQHG
jgi:hypothetical protein